MHCNNRSPIKSHLQPLTRILFTSSCFTDDNKSTNRCLAQREQVNIVEYHNQLHQAMKSSGLLNPPFLFMYCLKKMIYIYIKTYYITVSLATLADYIIRHQWESRKLHTETPAPVIGCNSSAWCLERSLWGSWKSFHVFNSVFSPITGVPSVRTRDKTESRETPEISGACAKMVEIAW